VERTLPTSTKPPFRAEHIGSLLRPNSLLVQRAKFARGEIGQGALTADEDAAILNALALQERVGLKLATDGEFRRTSYHDFFYRQLGKLSIATIDGEGAKGGTETGTVGKRGAQPVALVDSQVAWTHPINVPDYTFIAARTRLVPKITIPGPCALHFRGGDAAVLASAYKDVDQFWEDTVEAYSRELNALSDAGCRYVQIDETAFAKFGEPDVQAWLKARGDDWSALIDKYVAVTNRVLANSPKGMRIGMHLCRGNRGGQWHSEGSYDDVAERLFNALNIEFYFLEYDSPRAGAFTPLRLVPRHKTVVLGIVSTKTPAMESKDEMKKRIEVLPASSISSILRSARSAASQASTPVIRLPRKSRNRSYGLLWSLRAKSGERHEYHRRTTGDRVATGMPRRVDRLGAGTARCAGDRAKGCLAGSDGSLDRPLRSGR
jgi:5-methyltetrahydropteroyltriglutamate--homocysteine methyltransferase